MWVITSSKWAHKCYRGKTHVEGLNIFRSLVIGLVSYSLLLWLSIDLSFSRVCMIVLNWIVHCPCFVRMTQHWVGWVCVKFGWNWLRFGSKYYSNTWFYVSVCVCFATCVALDFSSLWFVLACCYKERKTDWGRETCKALGSSVWGIKANKQAKA